jgi:hypothetical protein
MSNATPNGREVADRILAVRRWHKERQHQVSNPRRCGCVSPLGAFVQHGVCVYKARQGQGAAERAAGTRRAGVAVAGAGENRLKKRAGSLAQRCHVDQPRTQTNDRGSRVAAASRGLGLGPACCLLLAVLSGPRHRAAGARTSRKPAALPPRPPPGCWLQAAAALGDQPPGHWRPTKQREVLRGIGY